MIGAILSLTFGILLGLFVGLYFSVRVIIITLIRFPINFFMTYKVVLLTVVFKMRLKLLVLISLTIIHILYPILGIIILVPGSVILLCLTFSYQIYNGENVIETIKKVPDILDEYWNSHKHFTEVMLEAYDHPSGIPMNWNGVRYDIPRLSLLQFLKGFTLMIYGLVTVPVGTLAILTAKYIFLHANLMKTFIEESFFFNYPMVLVFPFWLFYILIGIILGPLILVIILVASPMVGLRCLYIYFNTKEFNMGLLEAKYLLVDLDRITYIHCIGWQFYLLRSPGLPRLFQPANPPAPAPPSLHTPLPYWTLFISACQAQCRMALAAGWLDPDDVAAAMPSIVTCVPAMAVLEVLGISVERGQGEQVIYWGREEGALVCTGESYQDDLTELFCPQILRIKRDVEGLSREEKSYMMAKLCDVEQEVGPRLEEELTQRIELVGQERLVTVHRVCSKINSLVLSLIRLKEMQERLHMITNME